MASSSSRDKLDDALTRLAVKQLRFKRRTVPTPPTPPHVAGPTDHRSVPAVCVMCSIGYSLTFSSASTPRDEVLSPFVSPLQVTPPPPETSPPPLPLSTRIPPSPIDLWLPGPRSGPPRQPPVLRVNRHTPGTSTYEQHEYALTLLRSSHRLQAA